MIHRYVKARRLLLHVTGCNSTLHGTKCNQPYPFHTCCLYPCYSQATLRDATLILHMVPLYKILVLCCCVACSCGMLPVAYVCGGLKGFT